jgi:DNA-binding MarR family transcriptional regulator
MSTTNTDSNPLTTGADSSEARRLVYLIDEILWQFGGQGSEAYCCEDVSYVEYRALRALSGPESVTMQVLGQQLGFTKSGATRIVDRLEQQGYVVRERGGDDRRVCCVCLTPAGRELEKRIIEGFAQRTQASLDRLDPDMRDVLMAALRSFVQTFDR